MKHLHWLLPEDSTQNSLESLKNSRLASTRLRCLPSAAAAINLGWRVTYGEQIIEEPNVVIIGKIAANEIHRRQQEWLKEINRVREVSSIYIDYSDHHLLQSSIMYGFYAPAEKYAKGFIAPSHHMLSALSEFTCLPVTVIADVVEIEPQPVKSSILGELVTLLWFGHFTNINYLKNFLESSLTIEDRIRLIILSDEQGLIKFSEKPLSTKATVDFQLAVWTPELMIKAAGVSDMCIIPSDISNPKKMGVSSNRLITALMLGLPTAADNLPSYREFANYYCDLRTNFFREMLQNPLKFRSVVEKAQSDVIPKFTMEKIVQRWKNFLISA